MSEQYKLIDLFSGIGGIRLGFEQAFENQIKTVFASEIDKYAQITYKTNFNDNFEIAGDITKIQEKEIPSFDICCAGFPCVAFSVAGKRLGFEDVYKGQYRGILFMDVIRICEYHKPKVIFCENVKNLLKHDGGNTFTVIQTAFEAIGYTVFYQVLNSSYFDVPQHRERIYLVCFRNDIAPAEFQFPAGKPTKKKIEDILDEAPIPSKYYLSDTCWKSLQKHKKEQEKHGRGFGYIIKDIHGISGALMCGGMGRECNLIVDEREHSMIPTTKIRGKINDQNIRKLTPQEWCKLQGFPENFQLVVSDTRLYQQFGNTVTVPVVREIAAKIKEVLTNT